MGTPYLIDMTVRILENNQAK